ncbi:MAG TPA: OmpA family protein [Thermoanaerobaculia bacterium]|nr:OmpA family protein [Thermoanaerobaculia bacterium]
MRTETGAVGTRVDQVEGQVEEAQTRIGRNEQQIGEASRTAQEALQRATEAGKLAEGKLLYETVLTDEKVKFGFAVAELSDEAKAALDTFANQLVQEGRGVYIEVQGHTDAVGSETYNEHLGMERAEAVRRYLSQQHKFPLHRMNVISYGETAAVADNGSREGRAQNRRVALVVLR